MSHQENNACLQGRNVSSPDGEETIPGKRETTSRRRVIFCTLFRKPARDSDSSAAREGFLNL